MRGSLGPKLATGLASMRLRLAALLVLTMLVVAVLLVLATRTILLAQLDQRIEGALLQERQEFTRFLAEGIDPATGGGVSGNLRRAGILFLERNVLDQGEAVLILPSDAAIVSSIGAPYQLDEDRALRADLASQETPRIRDLDTPAGPAKVLTVPIRRRGERVGDLVIANFLDQERQEVTDAVNVVARVAGIAVLFIGIVAWTLAGGALRPLRQMTATARRITEEDLSQRLPDRGGRDEVAVLVRTFNGMLDRLERGMAGQRDFLADAGHELRTPLTIIHGNVEQLRAKIVEPSEEPAVFNLLHAEVVRMGRLVDDLLLLARSELPDFVRIRAVDLDEVTMAIFDRAQAIEGPSWHAEVGEGVIAADEERLIQAALNLVSNAARHSPAGGAVTIGSRLHGGLAELWVADSGPGIPASERARILDRHARGADRRRFGTGLGLTIARTVAEAHGGSIEISDSPHGGARVALVLPQPGDRSVT